MTISPGSRLGPYEIESFIGAGGMGEVYRARDTRLNRTVAIKILSAAAGDPALRERFEREAQAVAALNHPHICILHDIGHQNGIDFLVMEYLEGETLADRLSKGPLPLNQVLRHATQIANALDKAHRHGIIHRDLKPSNIILTQSGLKLLDFGLAKLRRSGVGVLEGVSVLTRSAPLTAEGMIVGTLQYMAPEQLKGKEADARTDIFAFGTILYEMATGRKAFQGDSQASLISDIMSSEPSLLSASQPLASPALDRLTERSLAKDPDQRWQSSADLEDELKWIARAGSGASGSVLTTTRRTKRFYLPWIALAPVLALAIAGFVAYRLRASPETTLMRFVVPATATTTFLQPEISPDGRQLVLHVHTRDGEDSLWVRPIDSLVSRVLPGTDKPDLPFWSPDSRFIGFSAGGKLKKTAISGGSLQTLGDAPQFRGGTWNRDGVILFAPTANGPIYRVSAAGGTPVAVTSLDSARQEDSHRWPYFLPDGKRFLYLARSSQKEKSAIYVGSLEARETKLLLAGDLRAAYAAPGHLLFLREHTLVAQPFSLRGLEVAGEPSPIAEQVMRNAAGHASFSASNNGILVYTSVGVPSTTFVWFDRGGRQPVPSSLPSFDRDFWLLPDERRVAVARADPATDNVDIWLIDLSRNTASRVTFDTSASEECPVSSPDGTHVIFVSARGGSYRLNLKALSTIGPEETLLTSSRDVCPNDWSPDGRFVIYQSWELGGHFDLLLLPLYGDRQPVPFLRTQFNERHARFSPDGSWLAYVSDESGRYEVYVQSFPVPRGKWQISTAGGADPKWGRNGKELFYLAPDGKLMSVEVRLGSKIEASTPKTLFDTGIGQIGVTNYRNHYAVAADGEHLLVRTFDEHASRPINVVLNWTAGLNK